MKFAKELDRDAVPEWRSTYLNYKKGKKLLKAITRAQHAAGTTRSGSIRQRGTYRSSSTGAATAEGFVTDNAHLSQTSGTSLPEDANGSTPSRRRVAHSEPINVTASTDRTDHPPRSHTDETYDRSRNIPFTNATSERRDHTIRRPSRDRLGEPLHPERVPLNPDRNMQRGLRRYGSIIGSPSDGDPFTPERYLSQYDCGKPESIALPDPALDPNQVSPHLDPLKPTISRSDRRASFSLASYSSGRNAYEVGKTKALHPQHGHLPSRYRTLLTPTRTISSPHTTDNDRPLFKRVLSIGTRATSQMNDGTDVSLRNYREMELRESEFFRFLDLEVEKVEKFYNDRERDATARLDLLREQLHMMRELRIRWIVNHRNAERSENLNDMSSSNPEQSGTPSSQTTGVAVRVSHVLHVMRHGRLGKNSKAFRDLATPPALQSHPGEQSGVASDYTRTSSYRAAKRQLKIAFQEYYRSLDLLRSYALLNQKAFKKICKKFDKNVGAKIQHQYMSDKVNVRWFVRSDILERHIQDVEDLYSRYFEAGNRKVAISKLRIKANKRHDYSLSAGLSGAYLGIGLTTGILGLTEAHTFSLSTEVGVAENTSYLLQIYGGYLLLVLLSMMFGIASRFWTRHNINYSFIFEFDLRHHLDYREFFELPCLFFSFLGLTLYLNFNAALPEDMFIYWPVVLVGLTVVLLALPIPQLMHRSRIWLLYSSFRLLLPFWYSVEFRDFFLGDMLCSLTYVMGNIELFFCLYARGWTNNAQCNSRNSALLGFLTTVPGIIRAIQCGHRVYLTRKAWPQLYNLAKYFATIAFYMSLSLYRINQNTATKSIFITFATVNSVYCIFWDIFIDWSLGNPAAHPKYLRRTRGFKSGWPYYLASIVDPILRFNWIFYAIFGDEVQHSALLSFFVALSEVFRRGMWAIFRVENEHTMNVKLRQAHKDKPLPYKVSASVAPRISEETASDEARPTSPAQLEQASTRDSQRSGLHTVGTLLQTAHRADFQRRKKPEDDVEADSDDDDSEDSDEDVKDMESTEHNRL
ncbi:EXS-domain-containing protein [Pseudovirgaria hyperparasitica]|uniref:EXS-domain-containing protein n=1 Tax=Pseudovirgaria hyperparasitica TaxID=470096 RepID=A0A6A6W9J0_9PEZI|nr:EXS-domain-containing protein [Pseudovirgaria hyperparasitica]KAF2758536.1 EXS-domain-containing protein [Pseudovirgaria hyperparasitica]